MTKITMAFLILFVVSLAGLTPFPARAWSVEGHQMITGYSVELLPQPWKELFSYYEWYLAETTAYPDTYYRGMDPNEGPRHYVDLEVWNPNKPSTGILPQSVEEFAHKMQIAIEAQDWNNAFLFAGRVAHYVEDDTQPYHTTMNYDPVNRAGIGLHSVLDSSLVAHLSEIHILSASSFGILTPIENLTDFTLRLAVQSHSFLSTINQTLIDQGLDWSPELTQIIENRTNTAIEAVARVWYTAIARAKISPPEISPHNQLRIEIENVTETNGGLTAIRLHVFDSLGVSTYADVALVTDGSTYRGQVANVFPPIGEYVIISEEGIHQDDRVAAQRDGYTSATITLGDTSIPLTQTESGSSWVDLVRQAVKSLLVVTVVALVVMFGAILALLILSRIRDS